MEIINGNHEDLYDALRLGGVDLVLNDQRRTFSDAYVNQILITSECYVELSARSPLSAREGLTAEELRGTSCILVTSPAQQDNKRTDYQKIVGIQGKFLFAENLEAARLLVIGGKGWLPVEGAPRQHAQAAPLCRVPLLRDGKPILRNYCAFWKVGSQNPYVEDFAQASQKQFTGRSQ